MKFLDILLKEGRKEDLKKKYSDKYDEEDLDFILGISDLQDFNHKYTDFVLKVTDPEIDASPDWIEEVIDGVKMFDKYQSQLDKKDINQYRSFDELEKALKPFREKEEEKKLENQTEKIYEDENFLVLIPKTQEASCKYGSGTKWCVTQTSGGHFERYTRGKQGLYFIIRKKGFQTQQHYKVAVHINDIGSETWWDSKDNSMTDSSIELFKEYFPELYSKIKQHSEEKRKPNLEEVNKIFDEKSQVVHLTENFKRIANENLRIVTEGFDRIPDMPGKAMGSAKIYINDRLIDAYDMFVSYEINTKGLSLTIGFDVFGELDDNDFTPQFDFEFWKGWGIDGNYDYTKNLTDTEMRKQILGFIASRIQQKVSSTPNFEAFVLGITDPVWTPDRFNYGYTFQKSDKGLIKKLVDYLDDGYDNGTKLDFLEYIGKLKSKVENGKKLYRHSYSEKYFPSSQFRGHFASFFASAKNAGIIQYQKQGSKFIMKKGPNFDAFKEGRLRAL